MSDLASQADEPTLPMNNKRVGGSLCRNWRVGADKPTLPTNDSMDGKYWANGGESGRLSVMTDTRCISGATPWIACARIRKFLEVRNTCYPVGSWF